VHVVIETPRGSRAKLAYDPKLETFTLTKSLLVGLTYPHDWGFVPSTRAEVGDPLDVMVIHDAATFPGLMLACRIVGILQIRQKNKGKAERNDRLFAVPRRSHSERGLRDVPELSKPFREELEKFFIATDELEDKKLDIIGWKGPKVAQKAIKDAAKSFAKKGSDFRRQNLGTRDKNRSFSSRRPKQPWLAVWGTALLWMNARTVATL
jgi:inorganic pyrophosphatase